LIGLSHRESATKWAKYNVFRKKSPVAGNGLAIDKNINIRIIMEEILPERYVRFKI